MYRDIKEFFKKNLPDLKPDQELYRRLKEFRIQWSTKTEDYIDFLGSKLLGVHNIRFSVLDDKDLMENVFKIYDYEKLQEEIFKVKGIERNFKVGSNIIYHTLVYVAHLALIDSKLPKDIKDGIVRESCLIMQYKMFTSLYSKYFDYRTTEAIATTVYNRLSHKFLIKQKESWQDVFEYRVESCLDKKHTNYKKLIRYTTEDAIRVITDIQTKLREQVKQIYRILMDVLEKSEVTQQETATFIGGERNEEQLRDVSSDIYERINVLKNIVYTDDYLDSNIMEIVDKMFNNINKDILNKFIECMNQEDFIDRNTHYFIIESIMLITDEYLQRIKLNMDNKKEIPKIIILVKNYWSSSKVKNETMNIIKEILRERAYACVKKKTSWLLVSLVIAYILYVVIRGIKK